MKPDGPDHLEWKGRRPGAATFEQLNNAWSSAPDGRTAARVILAYARGAMKCGERYQRGGRKMLPDRLDKTMERCDQRA